MVALGAPRAGKHESLAGAEPVPHDREKTAHAAAQAPSQRIANHHMAVVSDWSSVRDVISESESQSIICDSVTMASIVITSTSNRRRYEIAIPNRTERTPAAIVDAAKNPNITFWFVIPNDIDVYLIDRARSTNDLDVLGIADQSTQFVVRIPPVFHQFPQEQPFGFDAIHITRH